MSSSAGALSRPIGGRAARKGWISAGIRRKTKEERGYFSMIKTWDSTSVAFRQFVAAHRAPVIMQVVPALNSGGVEQGVIDINAAVVKAGGRSIVVSNGGARA